MYTCMRARGPRPYEAEKNAFLFQTGAIRGCYGHLTLHLMYHCFYSKLVRLEVKIFKSAMKSSGAVSIPNWCD